MTYNKIFLVLSATTILLVSTILSISTFTNVATFAQSEEGTNQTGEAIQQNVSDVVTNISKGAKSVGSNITTEVAKEAAENIGKKLQDLAK